MSDSIPKQTIQTFARTICAEAKKYGFEQIDMVRLINEMMDVSSAQTYSPREARAEPNPVDGGWQVREFPLASDRLRIRRADADEDKILLENWMADHYGRHFLLSSATAQSMDLDALLSHARNDVGIVLGNDDEPIGAVAFLDIDQQQKRAELRKLIGAPAARGQGFAEEATRLWIHYGGKVLGLQKFFVSTLQTHLRNVQLNESIGFRVEGLLQREVLIAGERHDVLRMGLCYDEFDQPS